MLSTFDQTLMQISMALSYASRTPSTPTHFKTPQSLTSNPKSQSHSPATSYPSHSTRASHLRPPHTLHLPAETPLVSQGSPHQRSAKPQPDSAAAVSLFSSFLVISMLLGATFGGLGRGSYARGGGSGVGMLLMSVLPVKRETAVRS